MKNLITILCLCLFSVSFGQEIEWVKTYNISPIDDYGYTISRTSDCGYIIGGKGYDDFNISDPDIKILKINGEGHYLWDKNFGGDLNPNPGESVIQTSDGGYIIVGTTSSFSDNSLLLIKTDSNGETCDYSDNGYCYLNQNQWVKTFSSCYWFNPGNGGQWWCGSSGTKIKETFDGGYIILGMSSSYNPDNNGNTSGDIWIIKTDSEGNTCDYNNNQECFEGDIDGDNVFVKVFGSVGGDSGSDIHTVDDGYIITSNTNYPTFGNTDIWLLKLDLSGNLVWDKRFGGIYDDIVRTVKQTNDGGYFLTGTTQSYNSGYGLQYNDVWVIKTDSNGETCDYSDNGDCYLNQNQWVKTFGIDTYNGLGVIEEGKSGQQTLDGGYIIFGEEDPVGDGGRNIWLIKTDTNGEIEWEQTYDGDEHDYGFHGFQNSDGSYINVGFSKSLSDDGYNEILVLKIKGDEECINGDLNLDEIINIQDIIVLINNILNNSCDFCSDLNDDNLINIQDVIILIGIILD